MTIRTVLRPFVPLGMLCLSAPTVLAQAHAEQEIQALREEIELLRERLERLERRGRPESQATIIEEAVSAEPSADEAEELEPLTSASPGTERALVSVEAPAEPAVDFGGALRFNLVHRDFVDASESKYGESGLDIFRLNVDGQLDNIIVSAEYRFYSYMDTLRYGWLGYEFEDDSQLQFGIHQVPFGLLPYAAHNAWFGVPYYVGLADDYDMGIKYLRQDGPWNTTLAFYKNEELNDPTDLGRYGFDLVYVDDERNEEINRINGRMAYTFGLRSGCETEVGLSAQAAEIYNADVDRKGDHWAAGLHIDSRCGRWNFQLEGATYTYDPPGEDLGTVRVGAFESSYPIADDADILVANVAYNWQTPWQAVDELICYNDYSQLFKNNGDYRDSKINTIGCAIGAGPLFTYVDYILAKEMPFFGEGSIATNGEDEWHARFNINIGFYW